MSRAAALLARLGGLCHRSTATLLNYTFAPGSAASSCAQRSIVTAGLAPTWQPWWGALRRAEPHDQGEGPSSLLGQAFWRGYARRAAPPSYFVGLGNLRDNPGATRKRIRWGRGNGSGRGNTCGRGTKGQKSRGSGLHMLYDGGQLGFLKFPVTRQRPPYEVLYYQLGLSRVIEFIQLGLLDPSRTITMKDLYDTGCVTKNIKYGVLLYGRAQLAVPLDIQVTACDPVTRACVEAAGGRVTRVYYTVEGVGAILHPEKYTSRRVPLPLPAARWHPKYDGKFDAVGQIPPFVRPNVLASFAGPATSATRAPALAAA